MLNPLATRRVNKALALTLSTFVVFQLGSHRVSAATSAKKPTVWLGVAVHATSMAESEKVGVAGGKGVQDYFRL